MSNPKVRIILEDERVINIELFPEIAPISVNNFLKLINEKHYDGVIFHRVINRFMIQTGHYYIKKNTLYEKEKCESIIGEFEKNGITNNLKHKVGVISMARTNEPNSASDQFFICTANCSHLDLMYAAFGKVIDETSLMHVLDISHVETVNVGYGFSDFPIIPIVIKTIESIEE